MQFRDGRDGGEIMRLVQRRERHKLRQFGDDLRVDPHRLVIDRPAMHDAMAGGDHLVLSESAGRASAAVPQTHPRGSRPLPEFVGERRAGGILGDEMRAVADTLDFAFAE